MEDNYVKFDDSITRSIAEQLNKEAKNDHDEEMQNEQEEINSENNTGAAVLSNDQLKKIQAMLAKYKKPVTQVRKFDKIGRNDACPCGSGKKYKNCCLSKGDYEGLHDKQ